MDWKEVDGFFSEQDAADYRELYEMLPNGGETVEVGCFRGKSLASVADIILDKDISVTAVDPFDALVPNPDYEEPGVQSKKEGMLEDFLKTLTDFGIRNRVHEICDLSETVAYNIPYDELDLVFIDANHSYEAVCADIEAWSPLIKEGGILCGHDWDEKGASWPGVHKAVVEKLGWPSFREHIWAFRKINGEFKAQNLF